MKVKFRTYKNDIRFGQDYYAICEFLHRINKNKITTPNFLWGRWAWMISRPVDDENLKNHIGIWECEGKIVAIATYEDFGDNFICIDEDYEYLADDILSYVRKNLTNSDCLKIIINDSNYMLQEIVHKQGFIPTQNKESVSVMRIKNNLKYSLPSGYKIISMADEWDFKKYDRIMCRGFNNVENLIQTEDDINWRKTMLSSPHINPELIIAIVAPDGNYASHCGLWHLPYSNYAYVEPVVTDTDYRNLGIGKAAIYEAINRVLKHGANEIYVVSSQQFYYNIGFVPYTTETWWKYSIN